MTQVLITRNQGRVFVSFIDAHQVICSPLIENCVLASDVTNGTKILNCAISFMYGAFYCLHSFEVTNKQYLPLDSVCRLFSVLIS